MNSNQENDYELVVNMLSKLIGYEYRRAASEQYAPMFDADKSDDTIKDALARAQVLREIRHRFECTMTNVIGVPVKGE